MGKLPVWELALTILEDAIQATKVEKESTVLYSCEIWGAQ